MLPAKIAGRQMDSQDDFYWVVLLMGWHAFWPLMNKLWRCCHGLTALPLSLEVCTI